MVYNLQLDSEHDIMVGRRIGRVGGAEYVAQLVKCRVQTFLGEWPIDPSIGMPWKSILEKGYNINIIYASIHNTIATTSGVKSVTSLQIAQDRKIRQLQVTYTATTIYGGVSEVVTI